MTNWANEQRTWGGWRSPLGIALGTTAAIVVVAAAGTLAVPAGIPQWPRFWGTVFFACLLWPVSLSLLGTFGGVRAESAAAVALLGATVAQQLGAGSLPLPLVVRWPVSLGRPGDAIRREIALPAPGDRRWQQAWQAATSVAVAICTEEAVAPAAGVTAMVNDAPPQALAGRQRSGTPPAVGWYDVPVTRALAESRPTLLVEVRRTLPDGPPARVCGGQDDPTRPGAGGSWRLLDGRWSADNLADLPIPLLQGRPVASRYYVELRFYDQRHLPHVAIWY